jgi:hypothetical protein
LEVFLRLRALQNVVGELPLLLSKTACVRIAVARGCRRYPWRQDFLHGEVRCVVIAGNVGTPIVFVFVFIFTLTFVALLSAVFLASTVVFGLFMVSRTMYETAGIEWHARFAIGLRLV